MNNQNRSSNVVKFGNFRPFSPIKQKPSFYIENLLGLDHQNDQSSGRNANLTVSSLSSSSKVTPIYSHVQPTRLRPLYTKEQEDKLEKHFFSKQYTTERDELTFRESLGLTDVQIKSWLMYRREKQRFMDRISNSNDKPVTTTTRNVFAPKQNVCAQIVDNGGQWPVKGNNLNSEQDENQFVSKLPHGSDEDCDNQQKIVKPMVTKVHRNSNQPATKLMHQQSIILEKHFSQEMHLSGERRAALSRSLGLSESYIKYWFQNRRSKLGIQAKIHFSPDIYKIPAEAPKEQPIIAGKVHAKVWPVPESI